MLVAAPLATQFEGYRGKAYLDPAAILTVCYGETENVDPARIYSKNECAKKLRDRMARDYAPKVLACLPQLGTLDRRYVFGALLDASYNAGPAAVCKSRMAVSIRAGRWAEACNGFVGWYITAKNRKTGVRTTLPGLVTRRKAEAATCLTAAPAPVAAAPAPLPPIAPPAPSAEPQAAPSAWARFIHWLGSVF